MSLRIINLANLWQLTRAVFLANNTWAEIKSVLKVVSNLIEAWPLVCLILWYMQIISLCNSHIVIGNDFHKTSPFTFFLYFEIFINHFISNYFIEIETQSKNLHWYEQVCSFYASFSYSSPLSSFSSCSSLSSDFFVQSIFDFVETFLIFF